MTGYHTQKKMIEKLKKSIQCILKEAKKLIKCKKY